MDFKIKQFDELTRDELYALFEARTTVFAGEQGINYPDADGVDRYATHIFAMDESGKVIANLRIYFKEDEESVAHVGRCLVVKEFRGQGIGKELMHKAAEYARDVMHAREIYVEAQKHAEEFYKACGFKTVSGVYMIVEIPHVEMRYYIED
ncbi:MAG: GNAT family N-acetyltransferase [Clostridia bacterium]|nr:GNAT family N-acetyltransferase [Clostridia bacterium]